MAIETSRLKKIKTRRHSSKSPKFGVFAVLIVILVILPIAFFLTDHQTRDSFLNYQLARANEKLNRLPQAKDYFAKAYIGSGKKNLKAQLKFAEMCNRLEKFEEAREATTNIIDTKPVDEMFLSNVYLQQGLAYEGLTFNDDAFVSFTRAIKVNADNYFALIGLGRINRIKGDYRQSRQHLENAVDVRKLRAPEAHYELGLTYLEEGNAADALEEFDRVLSQLPPKDIKQKAQEKKLDIISNRK